MSGILNSKERIFDTIITLEGRRQIATGKLKAEYFSFTDANAFYNQDTLPSGSEDAGRRIAIEASSLPQDRVTFETDDSGRLVSFKSSTVPLSNGKIITLVTGSQRTEFVEVSGSQFASLASTLLDSSLESFNRLYVIGSPDLFDESRNEFLIGKDKINFTITNDRPINRTQIQNTSIDHIESLFMDKRLSHVPNFTYLPPVNKPHVGTNICTTLGTYPSIGQRPIFEYSDLQSEIDYYEKIGYQEIIEFTETSKQNNLVCQFFELSNGEVIKLDVIDFGIFNTKGREVSEEEKNKAEREGRLPGMLSLSKHVFFVGKVFTDSMGSHTFVQMFSLVFES